LAETARVETTPRDSPLDPEKMWFIRRERAPGLKEADMLTPLGVALQDSKSGGQHVHQPVVSRVRHPGLSVRPHRLRGGADDLHPRPGTQCPPLPALWAPPSGAPPPRPPPLPLPAPP